MPQHPFPGRHAPGGAPLDAFAPTDPCRIGNRWRQAAAIAIALAALGAVVSSGCRRRVEAPADLVLVNGKILTVDANDAVAEAVAVADGKIVSVGSRASIDAHVGDRTRVIDLNGRTATPGMIDSHVHLQCGRGGVHDRSERRQGLRILETSLHEEARASAAAS